MIRHRLRTMILTLRLTQSTSDSINSSPDATMSVTEILATPTSVTQRRSLRTQRLPVRFREVEPPIPITIRRRAPNNPSRQPRADETNDNQRRSRRPRAPPVESLPDDPPLPVDDVNTVFDNAHDVESIDLGEFIARADGGQLLRALFVDTTSREIAAT